MISVTPSVDSANQPRDPQRESEDYILVQPGLFGVFDSVGGRDQGLLVSHLAGKTITSAWQSLPEADRQSPEQIEAVLQKFIRQADQEIADVVIPEGKKRPASVAALCALSARQNKTWAIVAHVGDSRVYRLRLGQTIERMTKDQGYFPFAVRLQRLSEDDASRIEQAEQADDLSPDDQTHFQRRNQITCAIGWADFPWIPTRSFEVAPGDRVLLCTDGLHDNLTDREIEALLKGGDAPGLVNTAYQRSQQRTHLRAKADDISAIVVCFQ